MAFFPFFGETSERRNIFYLLLLVKSTEALVEFFIPLSSFLINIKIKFGCLYTEYYLIPGLTMLKSAHQKGKSYI